MQFLAIRYSSASGTKIFKILQNIANEKYIHLKPNEYQYLGFMSIVTKFKTDIPTVLENLAKYNTLREFHFEQIYNFPFKLIATFIAPIVLSSKCNVGVAFTLQILLL